MKTVQHRIAHEFSLRQQARFEKPTKVYLGALEHAELLHWLNGQPDREMTTTETKAGTWIRPCFLGMGIYLVDAPEHLDLA